MTATRRPTVRLTGRAWAYLGAILGGVVSIAANVAHSFVPPTVNGQPLSDWSPQPGAVVSAVFWPVALFIAVEILARVPWPAGLRWKLLRFGGLTPVALVAAFVSYKHLAGLLDYYGEDALTVALGPLAVDGLMVMCSGALLATSTHRTSTPTTLDTTAAELHKADPVAVSPTASDHTPAPIGHTEPEPEPDPAPVVTQEPEPVDIPDPDPEPEPEQEPEPVIVPTHLLPTARFAAVQHEQATGQPITADELAARLSITPIVAGHLLTTINPPTTVNGTPVGAR